MIEGSLPIALVDSTQPIETEVAVGRLPDVLARPVTTVVRVEVGRTCHVHRVSSESVVTDKISESEPQPTNLIANRSRTDG